MRNLPELILICLTAFIINGCRHSTSSESSGEGRRYVSDSVMAIDTSAVYRQGELPILRHTVDAGIAGVDSLEVFAVYDGNDSRAKRLFAIAKGGNIECVDDSVIYVGEKAVGLFAIADYSQEDQMFYLLFFPGSGNIRQSGRINLRWIGKTMADYDRLVLDSISPDSLYVSIAGKRLSVEMSELDCDSSRIINYYEYQ